ncbi:uncharacterized protein LOC143317146, partial [Chaetodon auriga]|uniref:uncharacterized protein LOC143317146 n=1 Tax=Chaetodon auriga TaxID=39042 RepID=UPI004032B1AC
VCLFILSSAHMATLKQSSLQFESVNAGENLTLSCFCQDALAVLFYWYKQTVGQTPKLLATFYKHNSKGTFHDEFKKNPRFTLDTKSSNYPLKISDLRISDSATYYCVSSTLQDFTFCKGTTVIVKASSGIIPAVVHQSASETIQPGGFVTLNCTVHTGTCDGEHSVYWFKNSEESHPGLIYTHGGRNDQCERKPNTQTHTCVYNLPMKSLNLSHAGTYYCAVASCGHIVFGNGTKLDFEDQPDSLVYFLSVALAFTTILVVLLAFSVYKLKRRNCQRTESNTTYSTTSTPNTVPCQDTENLHYAAFSNVRTNRSRRQTDNTTSECVYSSVKQ